MGTEAQRAFQSAKFVPLTLRQAELELHETVLGLEYFEALFHR
jgi:hypothetical protein